MLVSEREVRIVDPEQCEGIVQARIQEEPPYSVIPLLAALPSGESLENPVHIVNSTHMLVVVSNEFWSTDIQMALMSHLPQLHYTLVGFVTVLKNVAMRTSCLSD